MTIYTYENLHGIIFIFKSSTTHLPEEKGVVNDLSGNSSETASHE
jgi:hypothetical protein